MAVGGWSTRGPRQIGQVYDVNSYALAAAGRDACAEVASSATTLMESLAKSSRPVNRAEVVAIAGGKAVWRQKRQVGAFRAREMEVAGRHIRDPCRLRTARP